MPHSTRKCQYPINERSNHLVEEILSLSIVAQPILETTVTGLAATAQNHEHLQNQNTPY